MRCASYSAVVALLLALLAPLCSALRVEPLGVSAVASPHGNAKFEQLHVITANEDTSEAITSIISSAFCEVYVSYGLPQSPGLLATVRVVGDSAQFIQSLVAVSTSEDKPGELRIAGGVISRTSAYVGYARVEVQVHSLKQLQHLQCLGSGSLVVEAPELIVNSLQANFVVELSASGDVYLPPVFPLLVQSLQINSHGSGSLYFPTSDLTASDVQVTTTASGDVKVGVSRQLRVASHLSITSSGSGSCRFAVSDYQMPRLEVSMKSSGDVTIGSPNSSPEASVGQCQYDLSSSGELHAGGVVCSNATTTSTGSGDMTLLVKGSLIYRLSGYGSIKYVGSAPQSIVSSGGSSRYSAVKPLRSSPKTKPAWMDTYSLPPRRLSFVVVGGGYVDVVDTDDDDDDDDDSTSPPMSGPWLMPTPDVATKSGDPSKSTDPPVHPRSWLPVLVIVLVVVVAWNRVEAWKRKKKQRGEKAPLLGTEAPVYI